MNPETLIPKPKLAAAIGVSSRTLSRWMDDASVAFPKSILLGNRHYFVVADIEMWKAEQVRKSLTMRATYRGNAAEAAA